MPLLDPPPPSLLNFYSMLLLLPDLRLKNDSKAAAVQLSTNQPSFISSSSLFVPSFPRVGFFETFSFQVCAHMLSIAHVCSPKWDLRAHARAHSRT